MRELVGELVGFARPASEEEVIDVDGVLQRIVRVQRITLGKAVRIDCDLRSEGRAAASSSKIEQIVLNLISNAAYEVRPRKRDRCDLATGRRHHRRRGPRRRSRDP